MTRPNTGPAAYEPAMDDELDDGFTDDDLDELGPAVPQISDRLLTGVLSVGGVIGFVAAFTLLYERIKLLIDPSYRPSCSINPILSCGSVMVTEQARVFGFPNPILGVAGFAIFTAVGLGLLAGAQYARWYWLGVQAGITFGFGFVLWLMYQSLYEIGALCPYCMVVWATVIPMFVYITLGNAERGRFGLPRRAHGAVEALAANRLLLVAVIDVIVIGLITVRFWNYWSTLL